MPRCQSRCPDAQRDAQADKMPRQTKCPDAQVDAQVEAQVEEMSRCQNMNEKENLQRLKVI